MGRRRPPTHRRPARAAADYQFVRDAMTAGTIYTCSPDDTVDDGELLLTPTPRLAPPAASALHPRRQAPPARACMHGRAAAPAHQAAPVPTHPLALAVLQRCSS